MKSNSNDVGKNNKKDSAVEETQKEEEPSFSRDNDNNNDNNNLNKEKDKSAASPNNNNTTKEKRQQIGIPFDYGKLNPSWTLLSQGAEARIWKVMPPIQQPKTTSSNNQSNDENKYPNSVIATALEKIYTGMPSSCFNNNNNDGIIVIKERISKTYRHVDLDIKLTRQRCKAEAKILKRAAVASTNNNNKNDSTDQNYIIHCPRVHRVEPPLLYLQYLNGPTVKSFLQTTSKTKQQYFEWIANEMGRLIGTLHFRASIVHGDLTTSNMILVSTTTNNQEQQEFQMYLIDFGLAKLSPTVEEMAVDLYVMERALRATHDNITLAGTMPTDKDAMVINNDNEENNNNNSSFVDRVLNAYQDVDRDASKPVMSRLRAVRLRGRKRECFG